MIITEKTTILEHQNNKQTLQILDDNILGTYNPYLTELILRPELM